MSSGLYRKQYEALSAYATALGVSFTNPDGSFNQKFCELCRLIIDDLDGSFVPVTGGSFATRKASYLRQVAIALGLSITGQTSARETFLKSAQSMWDSLNDGETLDTGASLDWRVYQYLSHALAGLPAGYLQYINGENDGADTLTDKSSNGYDVELKQSACLTFDGVGDYVDTGVKLTSAMDADIIFRVVEAVGGAEDMVIFGTRDGTGDYYFGVQGGQWRCGFGIAPPSIYSDVGTADNEWHRLTIVGGIFTLSNPDGSNPTVLADKSSETFTTTINAYIGCRNFDGVANKFSQVDVAFLQLNANATYHFSELSGATVYDTSGNGNDGAITTTSGLTAMRAARQDVYHANAINGCSKVLSFDGITSTGVIARPSEITAGSAIRARFVVNSLPSISSSPVQYTVSNARYCFLVGDSGVFTVLVNGKAAVTTIPCVEDTAYDVTLLFTGGYEFSLTVNDVTETGTASAGVSEGEADKLRLASNNYAGGVSTELLDCNISEVNIGGGALTYSSKNVVSESSISDQNGENIISLTDTEFLYLPALSDGSDDVAGLGITNPPIGKDIVLNNCETLVQQNFFGLLAQLSVSGAVVGNGLYTYAGVNEDRPYYVQGIYRLIYDTVDYSGWTLIQEDGAPDIIFGSSTSTSSLPPKDLWSWPSVPVISYGLDFFINSGEWSKLSYADFKAWISGTDNLWLGMAADANGFCPVNGWAIYADGYSPTPGEYNRIVSALPNTCGAGQVEPLSDQDGILTDAGGEVVYVQPE